MIDPFCGIIVYHDHFSLVEINGLPLLIARTETLRFTPIFTKFFEYSSTKNVISDSSEPNFSYKSSIDLLEFTMNSSTPFSSSLIDSENLDIISFLPFCLGGLTTMLGHRPNRQISTKEKEALKSLIIILHLLTLIIRHTYLYILPLPLTTLLYPPFLHQQKSFY